MFSKIHFFIPLEHYKFSSKLFSALKTCDIIDPLLLPPLSADINAMSNIRTRMEHKFRVAYWNPPAINKIYLENDFSAVWNDMGWSTKRYVEIFEQVPIDLQKINDLKGARIN